MNRPTLAAFALAFACGASGADPVPTPSAAAPSVMPASPPGASLGLAPAATPRPVPTPSPTTPRQLAPGDRCEGLVGGCGGWIGCVAVRADTRTPGRFVGVGPNAGHFYRENHDCFGGVCNEVCTGGSVSACRPGVTEDAGPVVCSAAVAPSRAPFTCAIVAGVCTRGPDPSMIPAS